MFKKNHTQLYYLYTTKRRYGKRKGDREFNKKQFFMFFGCIVLVVACGFLTPKIYANPFKKVIVADGYGEYTLLTRANTVGEIYKSGILNMKESDSTVSLDTPVADNMTIYVDRSIVVNVISGGTNVKIRTSSGTAREILTKAGVIFKESDAFNMSLDDTVQNGDTLVHELIETKMVTKRVSIDFETVEIEDRTLTKGKSEVIFSGENGYKNVSYLITYQNGVEISRVVAEEKVVKEPVSRKIAIGTKEQSTVASSSKGGLSASSSSNDGYKNQSKPASNIESLNDLDPDRIAEIRVMSVTAYTHTGNATATGIMPSVGTVAVHTKEIPLGTKLYIPGYGIGVAQDTGGMTSNTIDIFMNTREECRRWGRRSVTIYILKY